MATLIDAKGEYFTKYAADINLDFTINWAPKLGTDTISTSDWSVPAGITKASQTSTATTAIVWLTAGTAGTEYECVNTITTAGGRTITQPLRVKVIPPAALSNAALIGLDTYKKLAGIEVSEGSGDPENDLYISLTEAASAEISHICGRAPNQLFCHAPRCGHISGTANGSV